jgi:hypothetical protein
LADKSVSAVLPVCKPSAEFSKKLEPEVDELVVDDVDELDADLVEPAEPFVPEEFDVVDEPDAVDEPDVVDEPDAVEELEEGAVGWNWKLPTPNPKFAALVPPIVIAAVSFSPLMVS